MITRLILFLAVLVIGYFVAQTLGRTLADAVGKCPSCQGKGYWRGTRGERNTCKDCNGTGKAPRK